jgi:hypothetical protein
MNDDPRVYHVQLKQASRSARAFNLSRAELAARIIGPLLRGGHFEWAERRWAADQVTLLIYESRRLRPDEIAIGRGWANAARIGTDVTGRLLAELRAGAAPSPTLREAIVERCSAGPVALEQLRELGDPQRLEAAVVELLREGRLRLTGV